MTTTRPTKAGTFRRSPSCIFLLTIFVPCSYAFIISRAPRQPHLWRTRIDESQNNDDDFANDEGIFFDDFDFTIGSGGSDQSSTSPLSAGSAGVLQQRLSRLVATQEKSLQQISENWKTGHWSVRGCSLDPGDADFGESKIHVSSMLSFLEGEGDETIIVGRTDGSLCWLSLGSEYLATFTNQYVAKESSNDTISVTEQLKRDRASSIPMPVEGLSNAEQASFALSDRAASSFEILAQVQASDAAILGMAVVGDALSDYQVLFTLSQSPTDMVRQFYIQEDGPIRQEGISLSISDAVDSSPSPVVVIRAVRDQFLLSVSQSGTAVVWKPEETGSSMVASLTIPLENDDTVLSCDVGDDFVYVGTALGFVFVYAIDKILDGTDDDSQPIKVFSAFANAGVSCIRAAGEGVMGKGRSTPTLALITGSTLGEIKQWELLPRGVEALEYWPKMSSQKLPGKAHLLRKGQALSLAEATEDSAILDLQPVQEGVLLSATKDQLTIWNTVTGKSYCDMQGLDFDQGASCLILPGILVTNGFQQYVCVHDFSIDPELAVEEMIVPMDDEDE